MKKQRIGAILLAGAMLFSMAGCGNSTTNAYNKYVELGEYKGIEYTKTVAEVTEDDIQAKFDTFLQGLAETSEVTDRPVEDGDIVNIDFTGYQDGVEFENGSGTNYDLTIGSKSFINGFESGLIGHEIGEEVSLDLTFPDPYPNSPEKAGQPVNFKVTINSISVKTVPELTDDLVNENTDYDTIDEYKEFIKSDLQATNEKTAESNARSSVFSQVIENTKISGYEEDEIKELVDETFASYEQMAASYGISLEELYKMYGYTSEDQLREEATTYVKDALAQKMIIYVLAEKEGIKATDEEKSEMLQQYKDSYGLKTDDEVYQMTGLTEEDIELSVLSDKVINFLMENAKQVDSVAETTEAE